MFRLGKLLPKSKLNFLEILPGPREHFFWAGQDVSLSLIGLRIGTQNINNTLYLVTKGCEASIGTIVCCVQIDGAGCHLKARSRLSCLAKKIFSWPAGSLEVKLSRNGFKMIWATRIELIII